MNKKICMIGAFAVGKTSLVSRFVHSIFSDKYLTTVGVKIHKKSVRLGGEDVTLVLWDIYGEDDFMSVRMSYLRGAAGYLLVADGTRSATLDTARALHGAIEAELGKMPFLLLVNKSDLIENWELEESELQELMDAGWTVVRTSAKTGESVEESFMELARRTIQE